MGPRLSRTVMGLVPSGTRRPEENSVFMPLILFYDCQEGHDKTWVWAHQMRTGNPRAASL
jgi:hypothetical protein